MHALQPPVVPARRDGAGAVPEVQVAILEHAAEEEMTMNRYIIMLLVAFVFGGFIGMTAGMYLAAQWLGDEIRADEARKIGQTMKDNQACVAKWKKTPQCVEWY